MRIKTTLLSCVSLFLPLAVSAQAIPSAPSNLTASAASPFQINLSWSDTSNNEDGFKVERSLDETNFTQIAQVMSNTTNYFFATLVRRATLVKKSRLQKSIKLRGFRAPDNETTSLLMKRKMKT